MLFNSMMNRDAHQNMIRLFALLWFSCAIASAAPASATAPKPLLEQVQRLTDLLRDGYAVVYPQATLVQTIKRRGGELILVVFTIEGFGGGNNHTQFLAAFQPTSDEKDQPYYTFLDAIPIAGKGWRGVFNLNARAIENPKSGDLNILIDALEVAGDDAPNFPSKKTTLNLLLTKGRLIEMPIERRQ